ncbi:MAG: hypothetical protein KGD68_10960 [Candidatus Lokiarchaeota archaeon]|nr:hypothetical protein [Candidatus Lokiarchaeota archaeon]
MEISLEKPIAKELTIASTRNISEIQFVLTELLYVPDERLKLVVVLELADYLAEKFSNPDYKIRFFYTTQNGILTGFVICQIDREYKSYGMSCPTFGWLNAQNFEASKSLMKECEKFVRANKFRKLRGPVNYPKTVGGLGFQTEGFACPMMSGVTFNDPGSNVLAYLKELGYKPDAKYSCVDAFVKVWEKGKELDEDIMLRFLPLTEIKALKEQIMNLAQQSFYSVLADAPGGKHRFDEMMDAYYQAGKKVKIMNPNFDPQTFADMPSFLDTWNAANLENIVSTAIFAFDRRSGELVGLLMAQPNLFQLWVGELLTHMNVDTVIIKKEYAGKGIFSALHNIGKTLSSAVYGYNYFEGTTIWANNDRAIKSIFPHSSPLRTHYVVQKRILKK